MRARLSQIDMPLVGMALLATILGLVAIFDAGFATSIRKGQGPLPGEFVDQLVFLGPALLAGAACALVRADIWKRLAGWLFVLSILALLAVQFSPLGVTANGATRWLDIGPVNIQPSELSKLVTVLFLAATYAGRKPSPKGPKIRHWADWLDRRGLPAFLGGLPWMAVLVSAALIEQQPDLDSACVLIVVMFAMLFITGLRMRTIMALGLCAVLFAGAAVRLEPYRWERVAAHADRWNKEFRDDVGYQATVSETAKASGGLVGVGAGAGRAKHVLPEATTDFILTTIGEEFGLLGSTLVIGLLGAIVARMAWLGKKVRDPFGRCVLYGVATWLAIQTSVNVMMANGTLPTIGLPLPFFSAGGSGLITLWMAVGVCVSMALGPATQEVQNEARNHRWRDRRARLSRA